MSGPHIHPEDLLERSRAGAALSSAEQRVLAAHLAQCVACRFERDLGGPLYGDVALGEGDDALLARVVDRAVARPWYRAGHAGPPRFVRSRAGRVLLGVAAAVIVSAASAAVVAHRTRAPSAPPVAPSHVDRVGDVRAPSASPAPIAPVDPVPSAPDPEPASPAAIDPPPPVSAPAAPTPRSAASHARAPSALEAPQAAPAIAAPELPCADEFRRANQARRGGDPREAVRLYGELRALCAGSSEEISSRVLAGRIYLDRLGDPGRALASFDSYLATGATDALREDALIGRALALGKMNRGVEEARAWRALLASYPDSIYAERAKARLNELR